MIRKMKKSDMDQVREIEWDSFYIPWTDAQYAFELNENPYATLWVICDDESGEIIGYYDLWIIFERAELANIAIARDYRKKGFASKLMEHMLLQARQAQCETVSLEVRVSNADAIALYEKNGFVTMNVKKGYYESKDGHEDAYFMMKGI